MALYLKKKKNTSQKEKSEPFTLSHLVWDVMSSLETIVKRLLTV